MSNCNCGKAVQIGVTSVVNEVVSFLYAVMRSRPSESCLPCFGCFVHSGSLDISSGPLKIHSVAILLTTCHIQAAQRF